jgi:hypothetical protein
MSDISITNLSNENFNFEDLHFDLIIIGEISLDMSILVGELQKYYNHFNGLKLAFYQNEDNSTFFSSILALKLKYIFITRNFDSLSPFLMTQNNISYVSNNISISRILPQASPIGFQRQFCSLEEIKTMEMNAEFGLSLGIMSKFDELVEVELRNIKHFIVDFSVCKKCYSSSFKNAAVTGLTPEQLIQIARYCTNSNELNGFTFICNEFSESNFDETQLTAICIWYLIEGIYDGPILLNLEESESTLCTLNDHDDELEFTRNSNKYWVRIAGSDRDFMPCTFDEYNEGVNGHISERLNIRLYK